MCAGIRRGFTALTGLRNHDVVPQNLDQDDKRSPMKKQHECWGTSALLPFEIVCISGHFLGHSIMVVALRSKLPHPEAVPQASLLYYLRQFPNQEIAKSPGLGNLRE